MHPSYFCWHASLTTTFLVADVTLVPLPITFCVVPARATTDAVPLDADVPRETVVRPVAPVRPDVLAVAAAGVALRADTALRAVLVTVWVVPVAPVRVPRGFGACAASALANNPNKTAEKTKTLFITENPFLFMQF